MLPAATAAGVAEHYAEMFAAMKLRPERLGGTTLAAQKILKSKSRYQEIERLTGVPWAVVGVIHMRESSCNFSTHLHCGDPLTARTYHVPKGRPLAPPKSGHLPYTFEESAVDALQMKGMHLVKDWSAGNTADILEHYNGLGYRFKGQPSPYLWAGSDQYRAGKYVADGKYSSTFIDPQPGCMALLQCLSQMDPAPQVFAATDNKPIEVSEALPTPNVVTTAATSKTVHAIGWGTLLLKIKLVALGIAAGVHSAFSNLPTIQGDVDQRMGLIGGLAKSAGVDWEMWGAWCGLALILYAIGSHCDLKNWLHGGGQVQ